jgi:predicted dehydrogenase
VTTGSRPLRLGVIGCGRVFERFHLPALLGTRSVALAAACDPDPARLAWTSALAESPRRCVSPRDLLTSHSLDAVLVLTPPATHAELCIQALEAGCHVLVEKPMALGVHEGALMAEAARRAGRVLQVGFTRRFREPYRRLRNLLRQIEVSRLRAARFELAFSTAGWQAHTDFLGDPSRGGGVVDDVLAHQVDLVSWLFGMPHQVRAEQRPGADGSVAAGLRVGPLEVHCDAAHGAYAERLTVELADGRVLEATGQRMRVTGMGSPGWRRRRALLLDRMSLVEDRLRRRPNATRASFERQLADFVARARGGPAVGATPEEGVMGLRALAACRTSAREGGGWVGLA